MDAAGAKFQKDAELMIDIEVPKTKVFRILSGETASETRSGANFQIIEDDDSAGGRVVECKEKRVFALGRIRWAIHEDELCFIELREDFGTIRERERLDQAEAIPATLERNDGGFVGWPLRG